MRVSRSVYEGGRSGDAEVGYGNRGSECRHIRVVLGGVHIWEGEEGWMVCWGMYTLARMAFSMGVSDAMVESRRRDAALV